MSANGPYTILLADDHVLFRKALKKMLGGQSGLEVVGEADDGVHLLSLMETVAPRLVILDLSMPNMGGIEAAAEIRARYPGVKVLILTMYRDGEHFEQAVAAGAKGYLFKEEVDEELLPAVEMIRQGGFFFSPLDHGN